MLLRKTLGGPLTTEKNKTLWDKASAQPGPSPVSACIRELDAQWRITYVNKTHCDLFGCEPDGLIGRQVWTLVDGPLAQAEQERFLRSLLQEQPKPAPFYCAESLNGGEPARVRVDWCYRRDHEGAVVGFIWWLEKLNGGDKQTAIPGESPDRELFDVLHDGVALVHPNGSFTYANQRLCELLGANKEALVGRSVFLLGDEAGKAALAAARLAGKPGEIDPCEVMHRHPNGKRLRLSISGHRVPGPPDLYGSCLMVVSDVTDRWRAETVGRRQAQIFNEITDTVLILNNERVITDCSASAEQMFGREKHELIGQPVQYLHNPNFRSMQDREITSALRANGRWSGEIQINRPDGAERVCEVTIGPFRDDEGRAIGYMSVSRDITARKKTEQALLESEQRYRQLVEMQADSLIVHDDRGRIVFANRAAAEFYRAESVASLTKRKWLDLLPPERRERAVRVAAAVRDHGLRPPILETSRRRLDGSLVDVEALARQVSWDGRPAVMATARDITGRKKTEGALRESEAKFRNLVEVSIQGYAVIGSRWKLLFCNDAIARMFGYDQASAMVAAGDAKMLFADEYLERVSDISDMVLNGQGAQNLEFEGRRQDGGSIWLSAAIGLVEWEGARAIQAAVVDITLRKEAEIALQASEARLRLVTDALPGFVAYIDHDARYQFNNKAYEEYFGIPREQLRGRHVRDLIGDAGYRRVRPWLESGLAGQTTKFEAVTQSTARRYMRGVFVPDVDPAGVVRGVVSYITDVSERKNVDDALRLQAALLENMAEGVGLFNPRDGLIIHANPKLEQMLGYEHGELLGRKVRKLARRGKFRQFAPVLAALEATGSWAGEIECVTKAGEDLWCRGIFTTFDHLDHGVVWVGVVADISEQKSAHEALRKAKEEAVRANSAKSSFLAAASHDLRQPLQASNLFLAALSEARDEEERNRIIGDLGTTLASMGCLLNALLDVSKLEAQVVRAEITDFSLRGVMTQLAREFGAQARQKNVVLRLVASGTIVRSDPSLIGRILGNFLANAVQYTDRGKILFGCRRVGMCLRVGVWDTGGGVPVEAHEVIFEEFYQHGRPRHDRGAGLGLGLAIVKRTADLLGLQIHVSSEVGKGSLFAIDIPIGSVERAAAEADRWSQMVSGDVAGTSIVVLDDDASIRKATEKLLRGWGAIVVSADNSNAVVAEIEQGACRPNVLIADYQLADEMGTVAAKRIREVCGYDIATIITIGEPSPDRLAEIANTGATALVKPVNPVELRLTVRGFSRRHS